MSIDYNNLADVFDNIRDANLNIVRAIIDGLDLVDKTILDFGCGTGNYMVAFSKIVDSSIYGVEPSDGMKNKALNKGLDVRSGNHSAIPFSNIFFDFIYMIYVIHHIPDLEVMFSELNRVLKPDGLIAILTQSHEQLESSIWAKYFPSSVMIQKERYPDISKIIDISESVGLKEHKTKTIGEADIITLDKKHIEIAESKGYTCLQMISEDDYRSGLMALKKDFGDNKSVKSNNEKLLMWLEK
jgi:ubiquinone/menaquinone biosynthesis C-methylase UbiE